MMKDEAFLAEAKAIDLRIDAITGQELTEVVESTYRTPKEVVTRAAEILGHLNEAEKSEKK